MIALLASPFVMCFVWLPLYTVFCLVKDERERKAFDRVCNAHGIESMRELEGSRRELWR